VVISTDEEAEPYAGATMIGPAPTAPPGRSRLDEPPEETTGNLTIPAPGRVNRAQGRNTAPRVEEEPATFDAPMDEAYPTHEEYPPEDDGGAYADESQEVTGSQTPAPAPKKAPKKAAAPVPKKSTRVAGKGGDPLAKLKALPKPALLGIAALVAVVFVVGLVVALTPSGGKVTFRVSPTEGAEVVVNGKAVQPNMMLSLPAGQYEVVASAPGHKSEKKFINVTEDGEPLGVPFNLNPVAAPPPAEPERAAPPPQEPQRVIVDSGSTTPRPETTPPPATAEGTTPPPQQPETAPAPQDTRTAEAPKPPPADPAPQTPPTPRTVVAVFDGEDGAEITVNGKRVGKTPDARLADAEIGKTYQFTAKLAGYKQYSGKFVAKGEGEEQTVAFAMVKEEPEPVAAVETPRPPKPSSTPQTKSSAPPAPKSKATGMLACSTKPAGAEIIVDGKKTGRQTPVTLGSPLVLPVGKRKISFKLGNKTTKPVVVSISENKMEKLVNIAIE